MSGVKIRVRADAAQAQREMGKLEKSIVGLDKKATAVSKTFRNLAIGITAAFTGGIVTKGITRNADAMTNLGNRVKLVTKDINKTNATMNELFKIAERSRGSIDGAAETFNRFGLALKDSNKPVAELLKVTEAVQKAATISGAGAQSANAAIIQLGQGLASGQLRGQELNSVLEQMPRLAQAIADGMGIPFGKLREEAMKGKITAEAVYKAILDGAAEIDSEFNTLDATVSGLATVFGNEWTRAIANLDKAVGTSRGIADGIKFATEAVKFFGENIIGFSTVLSGEFLLAKVRIKRLASDIGGFIKGIFTGDVDGKEIADKLVKAIIDAKDKVKEITTISFEFVAKKIDLNKDMIPSTESAKKKIENFTTFVKDLFKGLHEYLVGEGSWWSSIWDPKSKKSGQALAVGSSLSAFTKTPLDDVKDFETGIVGSFQSMALGVQTSYSALAKRIQEDGLKTVLTQEKVDVQIKLDEIKQSWLDLKTEIEANGIKPTVDVAVDKVKSSFDKASEAIVRGYDALNVKLSEGLNIKINDEGTNLALPTSTEIKLKFSSASEKTLEKLKPLLEFVGTKKTRLVTIVVESVNKTDSYVSDLLANLDANKNKITAILTSAVALAFKFGFKKVLAGGFLVLNAKEILNSEKFQASLREYGIGVGEVLADMFSKNGADAGASFIIGFKDALQSLGRGILDGLFGTEEILDYGVVIGTKSNLDLGSFDGVADAFAGALALALGGAVFSKSVRNALLGVPSLISNVINGKDSKGDAKSKKKGVSLASKIIAGLRAAPAFAPGALAVAFSPIGLAIGTAIVAGIIGVTYKEKIKSWFKDMSAWFQGLTREEIEADIQLKATVVADLEASGDITRLDPTKNKGQSFSREDSKIIAEEFARRQKPISEQRAVDKDTLDLLRKQLRAIEDLRLESANINLGPRATRQARVDALSSINDSDSYYSSGGAVRGAGTGTSDDIPAMLSNGEFVMKASAVSKFGPNFMAAINAGKMPEFRSEGGLMGHVNSIVNGVRADYAQEDMPLTVRNHDYDPLQGYFTPISNKSPVGHSILDNPNFGSKSYSDEDAYHVGLHESAHAIDYLRKAKEFGPIRGAHMLINNRTQSETFANNFVKGISRAHQGTLDAHQLFSQLSYLIEPMASGAFKSGADIEAARRMLAPFDTSVNFNDFVEGLITHDSKHYKESGQNIPESQVREGINRVVDKGLLDLVEKILNQKQKYRGAHMHGGLVDENPRVTIGDMLDKATDFGRSTLDKGTETFTEGLQKTKDLFNGIDTEELKKKFKMPKFFNTGGAVSGPGTGTSDDIPAMLSNGEFVMQASAVQKFGSGFMAAINAGKNPIGLAGGGDSRYSVKGQALEIAIELKRDDLADKDRKALVAQLERLNRLTQQQTADLLSGDSKKIDAVLENLSSETATKYAQDFNNSLATGLSRALHGDDLGDIGDMILDQFTSNVINAFSTSFADKFLENFDISKLFDGIESLGTSLGGGAKGDFGGFGSSKKEGKRNSSGYGDDDAGQGFGQAVSSELSGAFSGFFSSFDGILGGISGIFGGLTDSLGGLFSGLGSSLSGLFGGGGGGMDVGDIIMKGIGFFGFSQGGIVPSTSTSQAGKDSVPAMLMPGEVVLSKNDLRNMDANNGSTQQAFNINVQGDVSRQTRQEIVKMMPQIAGGVNSQNKENNFRG